MLLLGIGTRHGKKSNKKNTRHFGAAVPGRWPRRPPSCRLKAEPFTQPRATSWETGALASFLSAYRANRSPSGEPLGRWANRTTAHKLSRYTPLQGVALGWANGRPFGAHQ